MSQLKKTIKLKECSLHLHFSDPMLVWSKQVKMSAAPEVQAESFTTWLSSYKHRLDSKHEAVCCLYTCCISVILSSHRLTHFSDGFEIQVCKLVFSKLVNMICSCVCCFVLLLGWHVFMSPVSFTQLHKLTCLHGFCNSHHHHPTPFITPVLLLWFPIFSLCNQKKNNYTCTATKNQRLATTIWGFSYLTYFFIQSFIPRHFLPHITCKK